MSDNSKTKSKRVKIGIIVTVLCGVLGGTVGFIRGFFDGADIEYGLNSVANALTENIYDILAVATGIIVMLFGVIGSVSGIIIYRKAKVLTQESKENDNIFDKAEQKVDLLSTVAGVCMPVGVIAMLVYLLVDLTTGNDYRIFDFICKIIYLATFIILTVLIQKAYKLNKELNPNLDFNVFDLRIMNTAEGQSDEAQKLLIYKAAYRTMGICLNTIMAVTVIVFLISILFRLSFVPAMILGATYAFMQIVFSVKQYKVSHPKIKADK